MRGGVMFDLMQKNRVEIMFLYPRVNCEKCYFHRVTEFDKKPFEYCKIDKRHMNCDSYIVATDPRIYPCNLCSETDPDKFDICTETPDDNCPKYRLWIEKKNSKQYPDRMCPNFKECFLSVYLADMAPSDVDCTATYAEYENRCMDDGEEEDT